MAKMNPLFEFSPCVPKALINAYIKIGRNSRKLADELGVNHFYVNQLLKNGIEPTNPEIRVKLFLSRKPHKQRIPRVYLPGEKETKKRIALMAKNLRNSFKEVIS